MKSLNKIQKAISKIVVGATCLIQCYTQNANAQSVGIGATSFSPSSSAMLEVQSNSKGILIPRMTDAERTAIAPTVGGDYGLLVYQTNTASAANAAGYWYWDGATWISIGNGTGTVSNTGWNIDGNAGTNPNINFIGTSDANDFVFRTNNNEHARISSSGYFGIGTVSPTQKLSVAGGLNVDNDESNWGSLSNALLFGGASTGVGIASKKSPGGNRHGLDFYTASISQMSITQWGNVGIGTSLPVDKLTVVSATDNYGISSTDGTHTLSTFLGGTGNGCYIGSQTSHNLYFYTGGGSAQMTVATNGNVGIGIGAATPWQMLTVNDGICVDNNNANTGSLTNALLFGGAGTGVGIASNRSGIVNVNGLDFYQGGINRMRIWSNGQVCLGQNSAGSLMPEADLTILNPATSNTVDVPVFNAHISGVAGTTWKMGSVESYTEGLDNIGFTRQLCPLNGEGSANLGSTSVSKYGGYRWGILYVTAGVNISSDTTLKENIQPVVYGLNQLRKINPISYKFKKDFGTTDKELASEDKRTHIGFNAQELKQVLPEVVSSWDFVSDNEKGYKKVKTNTLGVFYDEVIPVAVNAIKDLDKQQQRMIEKMNISDFGFEQSNGNEIKVSFSDEFARSLQGKAIVTVTSLQPDVTLYVTDITDKGFTVKSNSKNATEVSFNWIAMSKINKSDFEIQSTYTEAEHAEKLKAIKAFEDTLQSSNSISNK